MALDEAKQIIKECLEEEKEPELQFGAVYTAKIAEVRESGLMITLYTGQVPFLLPNSQLDTRKIGHADVLGLDVGQEVSVKYFGRYASVLLPLIVSLQYVCFSETQQLADIEFHERCS